jgi:butyryl-CoA dehydrogenase
MEDMHTADDERGILDSIDRWVDRELRPVARKFDHGDEYPREIVEQMKELGLFGATISQEYGGLGLSASTYAKIVAHRAGLDGAHRPSPAPIMAACVERNGTEAEAPLPARFATGELRGGIGSSTGMPAPTCRASAPWRAATATTT